MSLKRLITTAFRTKPMQVIGPDWLDTPRFEISAIVPDGTTKDQLRLMWQKLLSDRFHLAAHHEMREAAIFDLVVANGGPKLTPTREGTRPLPRQAAMVVGLRGCRMNAPKATIERFADILSAELDSLVRDATGLTGEYHIWLAWTDETAAPDLNSAPPPRDALQEQLGLRLEAKKAPLDMLVLDHMDRTPTEN